VTLLVAIEGADGAGKATAAENVRAALVSRGISARVISFPRYKDTVGGVTLGEFLSGRLPLPVTPKAAAVLYGLDRLESVSLIREVMAACEVVIFDRYIASNMVYQASKVHCDEAADLMRWIFRLETETFEVPSPDLSIYLDTPFDAARRLMQLKDMRSYTDRKYDEHEADTALQRAVRRNYMTVADMGLAGPWRIVRTAVGELRPPNEIAMEILDHVLSVLEEKSGFERERTIASRA
jgi:dTMP kinase